MSAPFRWSRNSAGYYRIGSSFAMYYSQPKAPTGDEARLTEVATRLAGQAIERAGRPT